jgi:hypothetical protein
MCDTNPLKLWLGAALAAVLAAIAFIVIAVVANESLLHVVQAPGWMLLAAASSAAAVAACLFALGSLDALCACLNPSCAGECDNLRKLIHGTWVVLGIQTSAALAAAIPALVPFVGEAPMNTIAGALVVEGVLLVSHIVFILALDNCARNVAAAIEPFPAVILTASSQSGLAGSPLVRKGGFWRKLWKRFWN